jgi:hypothetical protein
MMVAGWISGEREDHWHYQRVDQTQALDTTNTQLGIDNSLVLTHPAGAATMAEDDDIDC